MKNVILELTRIQKEVLNIASPADQVRKIVDSICEVIGTDVCTLYIADENSDMVMIASHGLSEKLPVKIPAGRGLVGLTAENKYPVNVAKASEHPRFFYVKETEEERYQSFCGVPLIRYGKLIGVLVVQRVDARALAPEDEAFLVTLSSQLALLVEDLPDAYRIETPANVRIRGVKGGSGIGIGQVLLFDHGDLYSAPDAACEDVDATLHEWHQLLSDVKTEIGREQASFSTNLTDSISSIFSSYLSLLDDHTLVGQVELEIRRGNWLPGALRKSILYFSEQFGNMEDDYLRARQEDLHYLGNKLYMAYKGQSETARPATLPEGGVILAGPEVSVSDIASVPGDQIRGIVCFRGSSMSHTAILANALGIPAVMGTGQMKNIGRDESLIVDGNTGYVIRYPGELLRSEYQRLIDEERQLQSQLKALRNEPAITLDGTRVRLYTNSGLLADLSPGLDNGAEGIGLYRTEIPFMVRDSFPNEAEQIAVYEQVFKAYGNLPVYMRTLDIGGDKQLPYFPITNEINPALGWRGIRFSLDNMQLLLTQIRAMIRAAAGRNLHILLPMVSASDELDAVNSLVGEVCHQLSSEGYDVPRPKVGIMIEVPAAISQIPVWAGRIDFISIGSNDLSQYLLALDRDNARVASRYDHLHPAVIHELNRIMKKATRHQLPVSLCGEMASDPMAVLLLLGMGIRTLSTSATKLLRIKAVIRSVNIGQCESLLEHSLKLDSAVRIRELIEAHFPPQAPISSSTQG